MARELSLPPDKHKYSSPSLTSYRVRNGVLHNPASDRRTTEGVFHVAEDGLPVPPDKKAVPRLAFARILAAALTPPAELLELPFTAGEERKARTFLSLLLRPTVRPGVHGWCEERAMELRFFAPGSLAASLDFIESIFGNAGDPYVAENDAALDPLRWTGTTRLHHPRHPPHLAHEEGARPPRAGRTRPSARGATAWPGRTRASPTTTAGPSRSAPATSEASSSPIIADNYFGYSKKEVKAQISYSANLLGLAEEEHAGGALVFPSYNLGTLFVPDTNLRARGHSLEGVLELMGGQGRATRRRATPST